MMLIACRADCGDIQVVACSLVFNNVEQQRRALPERASEIRGRTTILTLSRNAPSQAVSVSRVVYGKASGRPTWGLLGGECDSARLAGAGYDVALVGGALMKSADPAALVRELLAAGRAAAAQSGRAGPGRAGFASGQQRLSEHLCGSRSAE